MSSAGFSPLGSLALARGGVDRVTARRLDKDWLDAAWKDPRTRVLPVSEGQALVRDDGEHVELVFLPPEEAQAGTRFLLGQDSDGVVYFGVSGALPAVGADEHPPHARHAPHAPHAPDTAHTSRATDIPHKPDIPHTTHKSDISHQPHTPYQPQKPQALQRSGAHREAHAPHGVRSASLREVGALLPDREAGLLTHAVALANWHDTHTHCPLCGSATVPDPGGHSAVCPVDGSEHFPRTDPAVIVLVTDPGDRCLLARNAAWPGRRVSILAGFVEPGESAEQAVVREVAEETGITVAGVRYLGSQPWPMPRSLMLGFRAEAPPGQVIAVDREELAEAHWFSREELLAAVQARELALPPPVSIARHIIEDWYGGPLPSTWSPPPR